MTENLFGAKIYRGGQLVSSLSFVICLQIYLEKNANFTGEGGYKTNHFSEWLVLFHEFLSDWSYKSRFRLEISEWLVL